MTDTISLHHIFTHDMRWEDNRAIHMALNDIQSKHKNDKLSIIIHGWICLDPNQLNVPKSLKLNEYRGAPSAMTFLYACQSLLQSSINGPGVISLFNGSLPELVSKLKIQISSTYISCAKQYTPFAQRRQNTLEKEWGDHFLCHDDHSLLSPDTLWELKQKKEYVVYSPFYRLATTIRNRWSPIKTLSKYVKIEKDTQQNIDSNISQIQQLLVPLQTQWRELSSHTDHRIMRTTRPLGLQILRKLVKEWSPATYGAIRNDVNKETSKLARFLNSGVLSIREVWNALGKRSDDFERELVFRSYYTCRMNAIWNHKRPTKTTPFPSLTTDEYPKIKWLSPMQGKGKKRWEAWATGTTGVPLIDASMRCLNTTGWLHNRLRMVVASYLTRILRISWRHGEAWFAQTLFDYDATQNHFGWKGQASMSKDGAEYFRVMNPWLQANKYDSNTTYIQKWVPELTGVSPSIILKWEDVWNKHSDIQSKYPKPLIPNHKETAKEAIDAWKQSRN